MSKMGIEKNRRFVIFLTRFSSFSVQKCPIGIYRKTGPTKSTVLGPRPPPWEKYEIYRFLRIFIDFGVFNRAGKTVTKIGIYSKPPRKVKFMGFFNLSRPNLAVAPFFIKIYIKC
jgi:putative ubiquitin-RnfH superfamily antitoxin RatB of RatAB toxin-antitoxin module